MPAATNKGDLLQVAEKEFAKLEVVLSSVDESHAKMPDEEGTTTKDIVAHRAHWIGLFIGWYEDGMAGKEVFIPAKGYQWNQLKAYNQDLRKTHAKLSWNAAKKQLTTAHRRLIRFIEAHDDDELYGGPMTGANGKWTPGRYAEAAGPSHYRSAVKTIRQRLRAQSNA